MYPIGLMNINCWILSMPKRKNHTKFSDYFLPNTEKGLKETPALK